MSEFVTADPQQGIWRILKPQVDFETWFQGELAVQVPDGPEAQRIPFFEWKDRLPPNPLDPLAGKSGTAPNLLNYVNVRANAQLLFFFPFVPASNFGAYRYFIMYRQSNLARYNQLAGSNSQSGYSVPFESPGQPDTTAPPGQQERFVLPAGCDSVGVHQPSPQTQTAAGSANELNLYTECVVVRPEPIPPLRIGPAGLVGIHQQGVQDPASVAFAGWCGGIFYSTVAKGDQMLICADRLRTADPQHNWDFSSTGLDDAFSQLYGRGFPASHPAFPELGIYMAMGTP